MGMEEKCRAIVLRAIDYKDNDKILTLFSLEDGVISCAIRGVKKPNSKLRFAAQPFCFCEYVLSRRGDKRTVVSADIIESFYPLREDISKLYAAYCALEFCYSAVQEGMEAREVFLCLMSTLKLMAYTTVSPKIALSKFLLDALNNSGWEMTVHNCHKCRKTIVNRAFFDFDFGGATCEDCRGTDDVEMNLYTNHMLCDLTVCDYGELADLSYPPMIQNKCIKFLVFFAEVKAGIRIHSATQLLLL